MHGPRVQDDDSILRYVVLSIEEVVGGEVRRAQPEGIVASLNLLDQCTAVR